MRTPFEKARRSLERLRQRHNEMSIGAIQTFLMIAGEPGIKQSDLKDRLGLSPNGISRNLSMLGPKHYNKTEGLGLIEAVEDGEDRRAKRVYLTSEGETVAAAMELDLTKED